MQVKQIRMWVNLAVNGQSHSLPIEKLFGVPIDKEEITNELLVDLVRESKGLHIADKMLEVRNTISHEVKFKGHDELLLEDRYSITMDQEKVSEDEKALFLLLVYGIKTQKAKPSDMPWKVTEEALSSFDPLELGFPEKMLTYLDKPENLYKKISGASDAPEHVELRSAKTLKLMDVEFEASGEHIRISDENLLADPNYDPKNDWDKSYKTKVIDLVKENDLYQSEGLLIWIPELKVFGAYDEDHGNLIVFPDAKPSDIQKDLGTYLQAQWSYGKSYVIKCGNIYDYYQPWKYFAFE